MSTFRRSNIKSRLLAFLLLSVIAMVFATGGSLAIAVGSRTLAHLEEMFDEADTNADGEVTKEEIKLANPHFSR